MAPKNAPKKAPKIGPYGRPPNLSIGVPLRPPQHEIPKECIITNPSLI